METMNQKRKQIEEQLIEKAMKDETYRKQLIENPKEIIEKETGIKIPERIQLRVVEEKPNEVFLVLPFIIGSTAANEELTEAELSRVAGGVETEDCTCYSLDCF